MLKSFVLNTRISERTDIDYCTKKKKTDCFTCPFSPPTPGPGRAEKRGEEGHRTLTGSHYGDEHPV